MMCILGNNLSSIGWSSSLSRMFTHTKWHHLWQQSQQIELSSNIHPSGSCKHSLSQMLHMYTDRLFWRADIFPFFPLFLVSVSFCCVWFDVDRSDGLFCLFCWCLRTSVCWYCLCINSLQWKFSKNQSRVNVLCDRLYQTCVCVVVVVVDDVDDDGDW